MLDTKTFQNYCDNENSLQAAVGCVSAVSSQGKAPFTVGVFLKYKVHFICDRCITDFSPLTERKGGRYATECERK
jgi:hypothetical protein